MAESAIEWTEMTWNPTTGCDRTSPGCDHCYALTLAKRLKAMGSAKYQNDGDPRTSGPGFALTCHDDALSIPGSWREPRTVFVNSMSDLFHEDVPEDFIRRTFAVMAENERHTFQVLTKRAKRLEKLAPSLPWPSNVWMGVSVETQRYAFRTKALAATEASVKFVSAEPLLGPVTLDLAGIDWLIVGGESGPGARPCHPEWVRSLRDDANDSGTAFFFKQWGSWAEADAPDATEWVGVDGDRSAVPVPGSHVPMRRGSKKAAGRLLDGRTWDELPAR